MKNPKIVLRGEMEEMRERRAYQFEKRTKLVAREPEKMTWELLISTQQPPLISINELALGILRISEMRMGIILSVRDWGI